MTKTVSCFGVAAAVLATVFASGELQAATIATCGASSGKAHYSEPNARWGDDAIGGGSFTFTLDAKNNPNVVFRDVRGQAVDAAADGAEVLFIDSKPDASEFLLVVMYLDGSGIVETYNVVKQSDGTRHLFWTANRSRGSGVPKVSAFVAPCR